MSKFKIGDRVVCYISKYQAYKWGAGTIKDVQTNGDGYTVDFDNGETGFLFANELRRLTANDF